MINIENFKKARDHFQFMIDNDMEDKFDFNVVMHCNDYDLRQWWGPIDPDEYRSAWNAFTRWGEVPCSTVCCVVGEIWLEFAATADDRTDAEVFTMKFLGIDHLSFTRIFTSPALYGRRVHSEVVLEDVVRIFDQIIKYRGVHLIG